MLLLKPLIACDVPVSVASSNITVPVKLLAVFTSKRYLSAPEVGAQVNVVDTGIPTAPFAGDVKDDCSVVNENADDALLELPVTLSEAVTRQ